MRLLIQRVIKGNVKVDNKIVGSIDKGSVVFIGVHKEDKPESISILAKKLVHLRIFSDPNDKMNLSLLDIKGETLLISQFTLYADTEKGRRPSFIEAAPPEKGKLFYERFIQEVNTYLPKVETGIFGAKMQVELINDGPGTFLLEA